MKLTEPCPCFWWNPCSLQLKMLLGSIADGSDADLWRERGGDNNTGHVLKKSQKRERIQDMYWKKVTRDTEREREIIQDMFCFFKVTRLQKSWNLQSSPYVKVLFLSIIYIFFYKLQSLVHRDYSKCMHTHKHSIIVSADLTTSGWMSLW